MVPRSRRERAGWATGAPDPPWWGEHAAKPHRRPLTREAIIDAALLLIDNEGVDRLTMRRIAERLEASAGALYSHVENKQQLLELLVDRVFEGIEVPRLEPNRWQDQAKETCRAVRDRLLSHGDLARVMLGRIPIGPNFVRLLEQQLAFWDEVGVPPKTAAYLGDLLGLYVVAFAFEQSLWNSAAGARAATEAESANPAPAGNGAAGAPTAAPDGGAMSGVAGAGAATAATAATDAMATAAGAGGAGGENDDTVPDLNTTLRQVDEYLSGLPADRFPNILAAKDLILGMDSERRFELGLEIILKGVAGLRNR